jgi:hypothetical protein
VTPLDGNEADLQSGHGLRAALYPPAGVPRRNLDPSRHSGITWNLSDSSHRRRL